MFSVFNSKQSVLCVIIKCFSLQNNVGISLLQFYNASTSFCLQSLEDYIQLVRVLKNVHLYNVCVCICVYIHVRHAWVLHMPVLGSIL